MASKDKDEKFNIDDLDWPDLDFDEPKEPKNDRSPVTKVAKGAGRAAKKIVFDENRIRRVAKDVLPGSHSNVAEAAFTGADIIREAYGNIEGEAAKTKREVQKSLRRFSKQTKGMFGDKVDGFIEKLGGKEGLYSGQESETERRRKEVDASLADIFGAQAQDQNEQRETNEAKQLRNEVIGRRRYANQMEVFSEMAGSLKKLSEATTVDWRFKRKTIELQLQQNMLMGDMLESLGDLKKTMIEELKAVVKNTALPEAAKIELTEEFKRVNSQKLMESLGGGIYGGLGDYLARTGKGINKRLTGTVANKLRDVRMGMSGGLDAVGDMLRMQQEQAQYGEDDTLETIMELAGGILSDKAVGKWGKGVKDKLGQLNFFKNSKGAMDNVSTQGARLLNQQAGLRNTHDGMKGSALDFFRSLLDRSTLNSGLGGVIGGTPTDYDEVKMRKRSTLSVVSIIPGLLARIHHEAVKTRTGDDSVPMIRFNMDTGIFTDSKTSVSQVRDALVAKGTAKANNEAVDKIIDGVMDSSKLTPPQRLMMRNHIAHLNMRQLPFDPKALATGKMQIFGEGDVKDKVALRRMLGEQYGVDRHGTISGDKDAYQQRVADSARQIQSMRYNLNDPRKQITDLIEKGHIEELMAIGAVVERNGQLLIDFDKINEMRFNEGEGAGGDLLSGAHSPKGMRALGGKTVNNYKNNTRITDNSSSNLSFLNQSASIKTMGGGGWTGDDRYNSQYQSLALEEIIDQLQANQKDGKWGGDQRYNSEYQTTALEEIIDVLQKGQEISTSQMETLNKSVQGLLEKQCCGSDDYNDQYQTMVLEEIMDILQDGRQFANIEGGAGAGLLQRGKGAFNRGMDRLKGFGKNIRGKMNLATLKGLPGKLMNRIPGMGGLKDRFMGQFKKNQDRAMGLYNRVAGKAKDVWGDISDWYKEGEWKPALEAKKLAAKAYYDSVTGKVVTKLSEVKGDIMERTADGRAQIALRYEEMMQGLRNGEGRKWFAKKAGGLKSTAGDLFNKALGHHRDTKDQAMAMLRGGAGKVKSFLFGMPDVYVKGESSPRLLAVLAKGGEYIAAGGRSVRTLNDITGAVADRLGNVVLSEADIAAGLVDADGEPLEKFAKGLRGLMSRLSSVPGNLKAKANRFGRQVRVGVKRGIRRVKNVFRGLGGMLKGFTGGIMGKFMSGISSLSSGSESTEEEHLSVAYAQLEVQGMILDQMIASKKKNKKSKFDADGDGIIEGSWRDLLAKRAKKQSEAGEKKEKEPSKVGSWIKDNLMKLVGVIGTGIGMLGTKLMTGLKWLGKLLAAKSAAGALGDIAGGGGGDIGSGRGGRRRRRGGRGPRGGGRGMRMRPRMGGGKAALIGGLLSMGAGSAFAGDFGGGEEGEDGGEEDGGWGMGDYAMGAAGLGAAGLAGKALAGRSMADNALDAVDMASTARTAMTVARGANLASWGARALPLLMNPYVLAGVAVVAVGYGLYKWWDSSRSRPLQTIRLAQYGIDKENGDTGSKYLEFEEWVGKNTKVDGMGKATIQGVGPEDIVAAMQETIGGVDGDPGRAMNWFSYRFAPVYTTWVAAAAKVGKGDKLASLDEDTTPTQAKAVYDAVKTVSGQSRSVPLPNSERTLNGKEVLDIIAKQGALIDEAAAKDAPATVATPEAKIEQSTKALAEATGQAGAANEANFTGLPGVSPSKVSSADMQSGFKRFAIPENNPSSFDKLRIQEGPLDPLRSVRMRVYGLDKLALPLVNAIIRLECDMIGDVKYTGKNTALYRGDTGTIVDNAMAYFGVDTRDPQAAANFQQWFENRFMPAFTTYLGAAHEAGISQPLRAHLNGTMTQQYFAGNAMVAATAYYRGNAVSVWKTGLHPIYGERPNANPGSVVGNMESLLAKVDQSELSEISGEKGGILSKAEKFIEGFTDKLTDLKNSVVKKATSWMPDSIGNKVRGWLGADGPEMGNGSATPATPQTGINMPGGQYTPQTGGGVGGNGVGVNFDPNGGPGGNVSDIPLPTQPKGFEGHMALIGKVAEMTGFDPGILAGLFASESGFDSRAKPGTSSAKGLGQFIDGTWETMVKKHGSKFGIKPGTSPNDPRANALMTVMYMKDNAADLKRLIGLQNPTDVDLYMAHFLGSGGYAKLYKNQDAPAAQLMPREAAANKNVFYVGGDTRRPRTGRQIIEFMGNRHIGNRNKFGPLMHAYIKQNGGKVDESIFSNGGTAVASTPTSGATGAVGETTTAANDPSLDAGGGEKSKAPTTEANMMKVDAGGIPEAPPANNGQVSGAGSSRTSANIGSDVTAPPSTPAGGGNTAAQVKEETQKKADTAQSQVQSNAPFMGDKVGSELVRLGTDQLTALNGIGQAIVSLAEALAKQNQGGQQRVPTGPMNVKSASSV